MKRHFFFLFTSISIGIDLVVLNFLFLNTFKNEIQLYDNYKSILFILFLAIIWILLHLIFKLNELPRLKQRKKIVWNSILVLFFWFTIFFITVTYINKEVVINSGLIELVLLTSALIITGKLLINGIIRFLRRKGYNKRNVLVIGYSKIIDELKDYMLHDPWSGYRFSGFVHEGKCPGEGCLSNSYDQISEIIDTSEIDELFLNMSVIPDDLKQSILRITTEKQVGITLIPDFGDYLSFHHGYNRFDQLPVITIDNDNLAFRIKMFTKRLFDITGSIFVIFVFMWWIFPVIALCIVAGSRGPVLFSQKRTGYKNKTFICLKFRTMIKNSDSDIVQASANDNRITGFGRFLRRTNLDELPQFFNVLLGQMSIVGPRPHMLKHTEEYSKIIPAYLNRHKVRPGITGLAQIRGHRGETREIEKMKVRVELDNYYIENWSLWLDIKIIFLTFKNIITGKLGGY